EELSLALAQQEKNGESVGSILVKMGNLTEVQLLQSYSEQLNIPFKELKNLAIEPEVIQKVPARLVQHYKVMPLGWKKGKLTVALSDPQHLWSLEDIGLHLGCSVEPVLAGEAEILEAITKYYGVGADTIEKILANKQDDTDEQAVSIEENAEDIEKRAEEASVIKLVDQILQEAIEQRATDIHIEPDRNELSVRYRVDGVLYDTRVSPDIKYLYASIISRIKIMARLDIAERRVPQDGRIKIKKGGKELDLRVSILPSVYGEHVVIRILPTEMLFSLEQMGLLPEDMERLQQIIKMPHGIILATGPTGSGKTTTLYASMSQLNSRSRKIITVEDPAEYELRGITQVQVNPKIAVTFATSLRSILRHDPDIIMVGEIRDVETAEIAVQAALTGHLVFSTLHTNDAAGGVTRLMHMGIQPYLIASAARAFIAQRLVRLVCRECKEKVPMDGQVMLPNYEESFYFQGKGCETCRFTGYNGRTAIYEILMISEPIRELILRKASSNEIKNEAIRRGMKTLYQDGLKKIASGLTTPSEIMLMTQAES
ncbi:MAG: type II secretion system protein GspE, partial [Deltaproteobacteria bacterium]|nr:type II secretion system protein GspE [Deltaproteobacteria bacterium]